MAIEEEKTTVSVCLVCMNKIDNIRTCLNSIVKYTSLSYEIFVVAYMFSKDNLDALKKEFPFIIIIESNDIRGFSENNNLALRQAKGKYCFVVNDDTEMRMPVIDKLVASIESLPQDVVAISPRSVFGNAEIQSCGRPVHNTWTFVLEKMRLWNDGKYIREKWDSNGLFETGDLAGAFFLIKTKQFREIGFFNEIYFFTPEDVAVSYELRKKGYKCYVDADVEIIHYGGLSGYAISPIRMATAPAAARGELIFYSHNNGLLYLLLAIISFFSYSYDVCTNLLKAWMKKDYHNTLLARCNYNAIKSIFSTQSPKEIFIYYFNKMGK